MGQRISKMVSLNLNCTNPYSRTYYLRDAQGNIMATETITGINDQAIYENEYHIYGSSRLGIKRPKRRMTTGSITAVSLPGGVTNDPNFAYIASDMLTNPHQTPAAEDNYSTDIFTWNPITQNGVNGYEYARMTRQYSGLSTYELTNHLGNVLTTIKDEPSYDYQAPSSANAFNKAYPISAFRLSATDYYPFGMPMPGRQYSLGSSKYRFGFGGQMEDDEIYGVGNIYTAEFWEYDTRIGKRWNTDPIEKPWESPYATFFNNPISINDPLGLTGTPTGKNKDGSINAKLKGVVIKGKRPKKEEQKSWAEEVAWTGGSNYKSYGFTPEENNKIVNAELAVATSLLPVGQLFNLGKAGTFALQGAVNTSVDYLAQRSTGDALNYTSLTTSFFMQGTGWKGLIMKNLLNSHLAFGFDKKGEFVPNPDGYDFGSAMWNTGVGFAFDKAFVYGGGLNPKAHWAEYTRARSLSQSLTKTATARDNYTRLAANLEFRMRMATYFKNSTTGVVPDYIKGVTTNSLSKDANGK